MRRFIVSGRVQGVYFRHSTRLEATRLDIHGHASNLADGSVEVLARGAPSAVEALREWLHRGPAQARVVGVREMSVDAEHLSIAPGFETR